MCDNNSPLIRWGCRGVQTKEGVDYELPHVSIQLTDTPPGYAVLPLLRGVAIGVGNWIESVL